MPEILTRTIFTGSVGLVWAPSQGTACPERIGPGSTHCDSRAIFFTNSTDSGVHYTKIT